MEPANYRIGSTLRKDPSMISAKTKEAGDATRESVKSYDGILATLNKIDPAAQIAAGVISDLGEAQKN